MEKTALLERPLVWVGDGKGVDRVAGRHGERRWDEDGKAAIDLRWRGMLIHAEPRDGRWMLSADGRKWIGPEVIPLETWGAATGRLRAWVDQYLNL